MNQSFTHHRFGLALIGLSLLMLIQSCSQPDMPDRSWQLHKRGVEQDPTAQSEPYSSATPHPLITLFPPTRRPNEPYLTPTPDIFRDPPTIRSETEFYIVQPGDSLSVIAVRFNVSAQLIIAANNLANPDLLAVWQTLVIPPPILQAPGPNFKIIPNSELVYGPASVFFDPHSVVTRWGGILAHHIEEVEGQELSGMGVVQLVAQRYSVNPRLLLAVLEYQSGWLTNQDVPADSLRYPIGYIRSGWGGLFSQLSYVANQLNTGYYRWRAGWNGPYVFSDGSVVIPGQGVNAGTASVQYLFSQLYPVDTWRVVVGENGFYHTYLSLFGNPFDRAVEPLLPTELEQPPMQLPFEPGITWSFTAGPHSAWDSGAAWGALDFAPSSYAVGCIRSNEWVVAAADGLVLRAEEGEVILDIDGDGYEQTGWVLLYLHIEERDRVKPGVALQAGDRVGHPSCEGGISTGTHVHMARKFNGEWLPADGPIPFVMDGWISAGQGREYDGTMNRGSITIEAYYRRGSDNQITR